MTSPTVAIATPIKNHVVTDGYHLSSLALARQPQILITNIFHSSEDLVRVRSRALNWFLTRTKADRLLFWDSDHRVDPEVVMSMLELNHPVIAAQYRIKQEQVSYVPPIAQDAELHLDRTYETPFAPMGLFLITREAAQKVVDKYRDELLFNDIIEGKTIPTVAVFNLMLITSGDDWNIYGLPPGKRVLLSEDYSFCYRLKECGIGVRVMVDPIPHTGLYEYK